EPPPTRWPLTNRACSRSTKTFAVARVGAAGRTNSRVAKKRRGRGLSAPLEYQIHSALPVASDMRSRCAVRSAEKAAAATTRDAIVYSVAPTGLARSERLGDRGVS